jgi:epoxide hydrolase
MDRERFTIVTLLMFALCFVGAWWQTQAEDTKNPDSSAGTAIRPFKMHVPDSVLVDLHRRLSETRWPDQLPATSWEYEVDIKKVRELAHYWKTQFDWRAQEVRINEFDQFTTEIDG